jgi:hypothetical protein
VNSIMDETNDPAPRFADKDGKPTTFHMGTARVDRDAIEPHRERPQLNEESIKTINHMQRTSSLLVYSRARTQWSYRYWRRGRRSECRR